jgi:hypothetical protein
MLTHHVQSVAGTSKSMTPQRRLLIDHCFRLAAYQSTPNVFCHVLGLFCVEHYSDLVVLLHSSAERDRDAREWYLSAPPSHPTRSCLSQSGSEPVTATRRRTLMIWRQLILTSRTRLELRWFSFFGDICSVTDMADLRYELEYLHFIP